jgi:hypothetical protein
VATEKWREAWIAALDGLEANVDEVEAMLADEHRMRDLPASDPWSPPAGLGPMPLDLRPRADGILARQLTAARSLALAMAGNRRQAAFATRVEAGDPGKSPPTYVDCAM